MPERFSDAVVLVAGGTGALGRAVVAGFLRDGARVVTTYRSAARFEALRAGLGATVERLDGWAVDLSDDAAVHEHIGQLVERYGHLDVLVNTVGGYAGGVSSWETEGAVLDRLLSLNLRALHTLVRAVAPVMLQRNRGCIVNIAAKAAITHPPHAAAYAASKAAALSMMAALSAELAATSIRANSILPSTIDTEANRSAMPQADFSKWISPEKIAEVIRFLCSPAGEVVRGAQIVL
ncbi:MAG TPA: SDR family NAD(P)-dependent oxidoreductase [Steroidobacteraceae bacterium]|nr:SDR family NAD(P)-dependent oxidoreductase [Steroidobacteraceae bacterium]